MYSRVQILTVNFHLKCYHLTNVLYNEYSLYVYLLYNDQCFTFYHER